MQEAHELDIIENHTPNDDVMTAVFTLDQLLLHTTAFKLRIERFVYWLSC